MPSAVLAAAIYIPLLLTRPGRVGADTKTYLYLDPGRMLDRAPTMWDANIGLGTVTHQNIGYLWPIGPFYWLADAVGLPDWVAQRLWLGTILFAAGLGVRFMLRAMGQEGPHVTAATFCYALTPYILTLAARLSVILLPYAGLPWMIGLTVLALRRRRWREPALFALVVATIGSVNATALLLAGIGPVLWIAHEVWITREVRFRDAAATVGRIGVLTVGCSLWWISGLWAQGAYGIEILRYTETAETVATASLSLEVLRGLGYWFFYGEDPFGPWIAASRSYMRHVVLVPLSYVVPALGLVGAAVTRFRERTFFVGLLAVGLLLAVGAHPWDSGPPAAAGIQAFLESDLGLSMRSLPRAAPLVVLALAVFTGSLVAAAGAWRPRLARPLTAGVVVLAVLALPPLWRGQLVDANLDRDEELPAYWAEAAAALDRRDDGTRVLEIPGSDFASYRWGNTVDPVLPGLMDRGYVSRELIPYGSAPSADLLNAFDHRLQEGIIDPGAIAPIARFMAAGDISLRSDLSYERYNTPRPRVLWELVGRTPGIELAETFGPAEPNRARPELPLLDELELQIPADAEHPPEVAILTVEGARPIARTATTEAPVILAGSGDGLVDAASAGLLTGEELVLYSATFADDPDELARYADRDGALVLTDTNRHHARRWGTVRENTGVVERAGHEPLDDDPKDQRLEVFPDGGTDHRTVRVSRGGVWADASSYGNTVSLTPEDDPVNAVDGDLATAWRTGGFSPADGETLRLTYRDPLTTDHLRVVQAVGGVRNRFIDRVEVSFDGGPPERFDLDASSHPEEPEPGSSPGQILEFDERTFSTVDIRIVSTDPSDLRRYEGISAVGFAEVVAVDRDGTRPEADDIVRLPTDLLDTLGTSSQDRDLAVVLTRERAAGTNAVRGDPEPTMARTFDLPADRSFALLGQARLSTRAVEDPVIDRALGIPDHTRGGVTATSSRRLPGSSTNRSMAAIDGDPDTWFSPGFLDQRTDFVDYQVPDDRPVTVDRLAFTVLNDGRHSVPRQIDVIVDGELAERVDLPDVGDQPEPNARHTFDVALATPVTGTRIRIQIPDEPGAVRDVTTVDWFSGLPSVLPVGIVEVGIDGLEAPPTPDRIDEACRTDLVEVDGEPVSTSLRGTTGDALAGRALELVACDGTPLDLAEGSNTLRTGNGGLTGFDLDRLVLRSDAGGAASTSDGPLVDPPPAPELTIEDHDRTSYDLTVAEATDPFWLVLAQSHNEGWTATVDGEDLGPPTLVNGYANGWEVPAGSSLEIRLEWTPQRVVDIALWASAASIIVALGLVVASGRFRTSAAGTETATPWVPLDARPSMPRPVELSRLLRYRGPEPSRLARVLTPLGALVLGWAAIGPVPGVILAVVAVVALRAPRSRPVLTLGGPLLFVGSVAWLCFRSLVDHMPAGFDWPTYFEAVHQPAWLAVGLLVLDVVVDRCWLRRWWPTDDSPR